MKESIQHKCEVCGKYHSDDEMEIVTVKIMKGIDCDLNSTSRPQPEPQSNNNVSSEYKPGESAIPANAIPDDIDKNKNFSFQPVDRKKRNVNPAMMSHMIPPDHELHEQYGAKEKRKI